MALHMLHGNSLDECGVLTMLNIMFATEGSSWLGGLRP